MPKYPSHINSSFDEELQQLHQQVDAMAAATRNQMETVLSDIIEKKKYQFKSLIKSDKKINQMERVIDQMATRMIALRQPMANDLRRIIAAVKIAGDLERMADYAKNIARVSPTIGNLIYSYHAKSLWRLSEPVLKMLTDVMQAYRSHNADLALDVFGRDDLVDSYYTGIFREMLTYFMEDPRQISSGIHILFVAKNIERMGDLVTNIADEIYYMERGEMIDEKIKYYPESNSRGIEK